MMNLLVQHFQHFLFSGWYLSSEKSALFSWLSFPLTDQPFLHSLLEFSSPFGMLLSIWFSSLPHSFLCALLIDKQTHSSRDWRQIWLQKPLPYQVSRICGYLHCCIYCYLSFLTFLFELKKNLLEAKCDVWLFILSQSWVHWLTAEVSVWVRVSAFFPCLSSFKDRDLP